MDIFFERLFIPSQQFYFFSWVLIVTFSICLHEYAHAFMANRLGDDTAASNGHLTLNPLVQMGISSLVMLVLFGIAWGAVPVDPSRLRSRRAQALVSFAGPAANLVLCILFAALTVAAKTWIGPESSQQLVSFCRWGSVANGILFLFNMLPIPMLDGWSIVSMLIPGMQRVSMQQAQSYSWFCIALLFLTPAGAFIMDAGRLVAGVMLLLWGFVIGA
jgi:Zn-dependent protease